MTAEQTPAPATSGRRTLGVMLLLTVLSAVLVLTAVGRTWAEGRAGTLDVSVTGGKISELPGGQSATTGPNRPARVLPTRTATFGLCSVDMGVP
ncbi:hypothetical protein AB0E96_38115, partial [Kitasatospora sp. NPDC036755]